MEIIVNSNRIAELSDVPQLTPVRQFKIHDLSECETSNDVADVIDLGTYTKEPSRDCNGWSTVRDHHGEALTMVRTKSYNLRQPIELLNDLGSLQGELGFKWSKGGLLNNGRKFFLKGEMESFEVVKGDVVNKHIMALDGYDGLTSSQIMQGILRMLCSNGQLSYDVGARIYSVKHTKNAQKRITQALEQAKGITSSFQSLQDDMALLAQTEMSSLQCEQVAQIIYPNDTKRAESTRSRIVEQFHNERLGTFGKSAWDVFNAFTAYRNHDVTYKESKNTTGKTSAENRFNAIELNSARFGKDVRAGIDSVLQAPSASVILN